MIRTLAAVASLAGLALAVTCNQPVLAGVGAALLICGAVIVLRHPEWTQQ
jgi:hypothetical protein